MNQLYIKVVDGQPEFRPYTIEQIKVPLSKETNSILPAKLTKEFLAKYGYYPVEMSITGDIPDKLLKYTTNQVKRVFERGGTWFIEMEQILNNHLLLQDWETVKKERNRLLLESDWVQNSDIVTDQSKQRYYAYRELLRDVIRIAQYPCDVRFPIKPDIQYIDSVENRKILSNRLQLSEDEIEKLKDNDPVLFTENKEWYNFLVEWAKLDFIKDRLIVSNLILTYTDTTLETVLTSN